MISFFFFFFFSVDSLQGFEGEGRKDYDAERGLVGRIVSDVSMKEGKTISSPPRKE